MLILSLYIALEIIKMLRMLWTWCTPPPCCTWLPSPQTWMRFIGFLFFLFFSISFSWQLIFSLEPYCIKLKRPVIFQRKKKKCRGRSVERFLKYAFAPGNQNKRSTIFIPGGCDHDHKCSALKTVSCLKTVCWASFQIFFSIANMPIKNPLYHKCRSVCWSMKRPSPA